MSLKRGEELAVISIDKEEQDGALTGPTEDLESVSIDLDDPTRVVKIGTRLGWQEKMELAKCFIQNRDVFAWTNANMCGISPDVTYYVLNIDPRVLLVKQK